MTGIADDTMLLGVTTRRLKLTMTENRNPEQIGDGDIIEGQYTPESPTPPRRQPTKRDPREASKRSQSRQRRPAPPREPQPRRGGCAMGGCGFFAGLGGLILVVTTALIILIFVLRASSLTGSITDDIRDLLGIGGEDRKPVVTDVTTIVLETRRLARLETISGDILVEERVERKNSSILKDSVLEIRWVGRVEAGVDLSQMTEADFQINPTDHSLVVNLPPAQLTGCFLQEPQQLSGTTCGNLSPLQSCTDRLSEMEEEAYSQGIDYLYNTAMEADYVGQASAEAQVSLRNLFQRLGFDKVTFNLSTEVAPPDPSCVSS